MSKRLAITVNVFTPEFEDLIMPVREAGINVDYVELMSTVDQAKVAEKLQGYDYVLAASEIFGKQSIPALSDTLKLIARNGVGVESVDIPCCSEHNIAVANMPGMNADGVGEYCLAALLALLRNVCNNNNALHSGQWRGWRGVSFEGTLGLLGFGAIAQSFARFCAGFPVEIIAYDICANEKAAKGLNVKFVSIDELFARSDFLSIHMPLNESTRHFVNADRLSQLKKGSYIINTSRGPVIDEAALIESLHSGHLAGAVLDVFEKEPFDPDNPLIQMENVMLSPHVSSGSLQASRKVLKACCDTIIAYDKGIVTGNVLNKDKIAVRKATQ